jgi:hypothetical protein
MSEILVTLWRVNASRVATQPRISGAEADRVPGLCRIPAASSIPKVPDPGTVLTLRSRLWKSAADANEVLRIVRCDRSQIGQRKRRHPVAAVVGPQR